MTEQEMIWVARIVTKTMMAEHPRPTQVNAVQAAEMLSLCPQTVRRMIKDGRLPINKCGLIPVVEVDRALAVKSAA